MASGGVTPGGRLAGSISKSGAGPDGAANVGSVHAVIDSTTRLARVARKRQSPLRECSLVQPWSGRQSERQRVRPLIGYILRNRTIIGWSAMDLGCQERTNSREKFVRPNY